MLTPLDIQNAVFHRTWRGYNEAEVDEFLDRLVVEYEQLQRENLALKESRTGEVEAAPVATVGGESLEGCAPAETAESPKSPELQSVAEGLAVEVERLREAVKEETRRLDGLRRQRRLFATQFQAMLESYRSLCDEQEERTSGLDAGEQPS